MLWVIVLYVRCPSPQPHREIREGREHASQASSNLPCLGLGSLEADPTQGSECTGCIEGKGFEGGKRGQGKEQSEEQVC